MRKKVVWIILIILLTSIIGGMIVSGKKSDKVPGLLEKLDSYRGYTRVISKEEYDFYSYFVERDMGEEISGVALEQRVKDYAGKVNAAFYLGNKLDLCEPYSFETLKLRMEQENSAREAKIADGQVIYGVKQFTLDIYFQYTMDNLQLSLMEYLEENADEEILKMAKDYYAQHKEEFRNIIEIVYEETIGENVKLVTVDSDTLNNLGKSDPGLADFLRMAEVDDVYEDETNYQKRRVVLKEITHSEDGYKYHKELALYRFVRNELYDSVIENVAKNNPVEFE